MTGEDFGYDVVTPQPQFGVEAHDYFHGGAEALAYPPKLEATVEGQPHMMVRGPDHGPVPDTVLFEIGNHRFHREEPRSVDAALRDALGSYSKAVTANPKDLFGSVKVSTSKFPAAGLFHGAHAMMDGAVKYGPYNWRDKKVIASIYVDAAERHLRSWFEGQETATDSSVHHLGHAIACLAIILDAQETGNLVDDRPKAGNAGDDILQRLSGVIKARKESSK